MEVNDSPAKNENNTLDSSVDELKHDSNRCTDAICSPLLRQVSVSYVAIYWMIWKILARNRTRTKTANSFRFMPASER